MNIIENIIDMNLILSEIVTGVYIMMWQPGKQQIQIYVAKSVQYLLQLIEIVHATDGVGS